MSYISIEKNEKGEEILSELREQIKDPLCLEFVKVWNEMRETDHI